MSYNETDFAQGDTLSSAIRTSERHFVVSEYENCRPFEIVLCSQNLKAVSFENVLYFVRCKIVLTEKYYLK